MGLQQNEPRPFGLRLILLIAVAAVEKRRPLAAKS
jgi:hypothetical protein